MKKIMMILMAAAAALTSCEKEEMPEEPIVWHETCAIRLYEGQEIYDPSKNPDAEPPYGKPSVAFTLSISGELRSKITGGKSLYRIVNYGKEKILFSNCYPTEYEAANPDWEEGKMESCGWSDGLYGETPATPDASYAAGFVLPAKVGTYLFEIQLHKPAHYKNQHHFRTPVYQMTITHTGNEWGLDLKEVPRPTVQP